MKKIIIIITSFLLLCNFVSCGNVAPMEPEIDQIKSICEMAVMECHLHNVVKYHVDDATKFLFWTRDKDLWMEYDATVKLGIDMSLVDMEVKRSKVTITLPDAVIQSYTVEQDSMNFYTAKKSAKITADDTLIALSDAKEDLYNEVSNNKDLLKSAQDRAKNILEDYINNIGNLIGKQYTIQWKYCDANGNIIQ